VRTRDALDEVVNDGENLSRIRPYRIEEGLRVWRTVPANTVQSSALRFRSLDQKRAHSSRIDSVSRLPLKPRSSGASESLLGISTVSCLLCILKMC
jgi:hypothetical protein